MKDVNKEDYDMCTQDYPYCGETRLESSNKQKMAGRRRSKTKKGAMRRKRMTKRRQFHPTLIPLPTNKTEKDIQVY